MIGVYKITSPSGKVYIGSSKNIKKRLNYYHSANCKKQIRLYNSIIKHGWKNHKVEILEECTLEELYEKERLYSEKYDSLGLLGLNCIIPSVGEQKCGISEDTRKKMSLSKSGKSNTFYGKTHSEKSRKLIAESHIGRKHSKEHISKVSTNGRKGMCKSVLDFSTGIFYESASEAARLLGYKISTLKSRLNGRLENKTSLKYV